jgi:Ca2+-binding RTX toxin-like protein
VTALLRAGALGAALAVSVLAISTFTAGNTVPATNVGRQQFVIDANALAPAACSALNLTTVVTNPANGTAGNDLILGTNVGATFNANGGQDCMVGGAGVDSFKGNGKTAGDVCIGNGGTDINSANKCQHFTQ